MLTALLLATPARVRRWVFEKLKVHAGVHEYCPGWCPCAVDTDPGERDLDEERSWAR